jgi:hypothetical protein
VFMFKTLLFKPMKTIYQMMPSGAANESGAYHKGICQSLINALGCCVLLSIFSSPTGVQAAGEQRFNTSDAAITALVNAASDDDTNALQAIFGPEGQKLVSPDLVQATNELNHFVRRLTEKTQCVTNADSSLTLEIGKDEWPFPIPLVRQGGEWFFDTAAGKSEILDRRIGRDELGAMDVCYAYVDAQREYASEDRMADGVLAYARYLHSTSGTHDGLFWPAKDGEDLSPLGPLVAAARVEGYHRAATMMNDELAPYHGYYFKILTRQGKHAAGGKYDYVINGRMIAGFALVAWPAEWANTGVMTFAINQQGKLYQCNLGKKTAHIASAMTCFDPDSKWTALP